MKKKFIAMLAVTAAVSQSVAIAKPFGVCTHMGLGITYDNIANIQSARDTRVEWIRDEARWSDMQTGADGEIKIRDKDLDYIKRVDKAGINQLLLLSYGNDNYEGIEADTVFPKQDNETYYNGYLDYVRYTVSQVKDYVDAYEIWNEPNIKGFNYNLLANGTDYAKLYLDAKAIIDELDPTAMVVCGAITGTDDADTDFGKAIFDYVKTKGDVNSLIDAFSIHLYTQLSDETYAKGLSEWEGIFDSYGYTGQVWMTENGVTADNDTAGNESDQAAMVAKLGVQWERYLKENGRDGISFWYDLRNDVGISNYEDNFGLVDSSHNMKPAGHSMKAYNRLTGDKTLESVEKIKTQDAFLWYDAEYGYLATYKNDSSTVYIAYDSNNNKKTTSVNLSGDVAYVYEYMGNITETINNPDGTKSITMTKKPVMVECVSYQATIDNLYYDSDNSTMTVSGTYTGSGNVTVELIKDGSVIESYEVVVTNGEFNKWFSVFEDGSYTVRVGYPELTALGKTNSWAEGVCVVDENKSPAFAASTKVLYNAENRKVNVSGKLTEYVENQYITVMAVPASMDIENLDMSGVGYIRQIPTVAGEFLVDFTLPEYYTTKTAIYLGGTGINEKTTGYADVQENKYVYVASFDANSGNTLSATALVRNFSETEKKVSIIIAQYNGERLETMSVEEKTVPAKTYGLVEYKLENVAIDSDATKMKAFIWSDMTGLVSLAPYAEASFLK